MKHQGIDRRSLMIHRIIAAAGHRRRLILFLALLAIFTAAASFVLSTATLLQILLTSLFVLLLNLITFRGAVVQGLVQNLTQYYAPQQSNNKGPESAAMQPLPPVS